MIIDTLENAAHYQHLSTGIRMALDYLAETNIEARDPGRYEINGEEVFVLVQDCQPKPRENGVWEAHRNYIDVQYVAGGSEIMGYAPVDSLEVTQPYIEDKDCIFLSGDGDFFTVKNGMFAVFFPQDAHMPGLQAAAVKNIRKAVVKIRC